MQAGVDLARQMGAALITFDGTQHTVVFTGDQCVDHRRSEAFLIDSVQPPKICGVRPARSPVTQN